MSHKNRLPIRSIALRTLCKQHFQYTKWNENVFCSPWYLSHDRCCLKLIHDSDELQFSLLAFWGQLMQKKQFSLHIDQKSKSAALCSCSSLVLSYYYLFKQIKNLSVLKYRFALYKRFLNSFVSQESHFYLIQQQCRRLVKPEDVDRFRPSNLASGKVTVWNNRRHLDFGK